MHRVVAVKYSRTFVALLILACLGTTSCTSIRLVSDYDEVLDLSVTQTQKDVDAFLIDLERDEPSFDESRDFYDRLHVDLRAARLRASLNDKNQLTVDMLDAVADNLALVLIGGLRAKDKITVQRAKLHLEAQKNASKTVLLASEGLGILAAEAAINAALKTVRDLVNKAVGFALL